MPDHGSFLTKRSRGQSYQVLHEQRKDFLTTWALLETLGTLPMKSTSSLHEMDKYDMSWKESQSAIRQFTMVEFFAHVSSKYLSFRKGFTGCL
jgi:hypothetical protein